MDPQKTRKKDNTPFQVFTPFWKNEENLYLKEYNYKNLNTNLPRNKNSKIHKEFEIILPKKIGIKNLKNIGQLVKMKHVEN